MIDTSGLNHDRSAASQAGAPLIGVISGFSADGAAPSYVLATEMVEAVTSAGGIPLILPYLDIASQIDETLSLIDGAILTGGQDFEPSLYGEKVHPAMSPIVPERDRFEREVIERFARDDWPLLGICRGMQYINVVLGGTIYAHTLDALPGAADHSDEDTITVASHCVTLAEHSSLGQLAGTATAKVNTFHHQAIRDLAPGLRASAWSPDGLVEAFESPRHRFLHGVQWHPEYIWREESAWARLFRAFVESCQEDRASRCRPA